MLGIVVFINLQYISPADDDQRPVHIHPQDFIHRHQLALAHATGFPVLWGIVGDPPCPQLLGLAGDGDAGLPGTIRNKLSRQSVGTAQEQRDVTVAQNFLPLIIGVTVLQTGKVLEHAGHGNVPGADDRDFTAQVGNDTAGAQLLTQNMDGDRQRPSGTVLVGIAHQLNEDERQKQRGQEIKGTVLVAGNAVVGTGLLAR